MKFSEFVQRRSSRLLRSSRAVVTAIQLLQVAGSILSFMWEAIINPHWRWQNEIWGLASNTLAVARAMQTINANSEVVEQVSILTNAMNKDHHISIDTR